jgi:hypothetical protein
MSERVGEERGIERDGEEETEKEEKTEKEMV